MPEDQNKRQAINQAYQDALKHIDSIKAKVNSNIAVQEKTKEQEQIDAILDKIKNNS